MTSVILEAHRSSGNFLSRFSARFSRISLGLAVASLGACESGQAGSTTSATDDVGMVEDVLMADVGSDLDGGGGSGALDAPEVVSDSEKGGDIEGDAPSTDVEPDATDASSGEDAALAPSSCFNGLWDDGEAHIDCGGVCAQQCTPGVPCLSDGDCTNGDCDDSTNRCATCSDKHKNGGESDVDCGYVCPQKCAALKLCQTALDCEEGGACQAGFCVTCSDGHKNWDEGGTDCGGWCADLPSPKLCGNHEGCNTSLDCGPKLKCVLGECVYPPCSCNAGLLDCGKDECGMNCGTCASYEVCDEGTCVQCQGAECPPTYNPPSLEGKPCDLSVKTWTCFEEVVYRCDLDYWSQLQTWVPVEKCNKPDPGCKCAILQGWLAACTYGGTPQATSACVGTKHPYF